MFGAPRMVGVPVAAGRPCNKIAGNVRKVLRSLTSTTTTHHHSLLSLFLLPTFSYQPLGSL